MGNKRADIRSTAWSFHQAQDASNHVGKESHRGEMPKG